MEDLQEAVTQNSVLLILTIEQGNKSSPRVMVTNQIPTVPLGPFPALVRETTPGRKDSEDTLEKMAQTVTHESD